MMLGWRNFVLYSLNSRYCEISNEALKCNGARKRERERGGKREGEIERERGGKREGEIERERGKERGEIERGGGKIK